MITDETTTQITKTRTMCAVLGAMLIGGIVLGIAALIGGAFLGWVIGISAVSCLLLFGSMINDKGMR
jgi:hypothetical protein